MNDYADWESDTDEMVIDGRVWRVLSATADPMSEDCWMVTLSDGEGLVRSALLERV